ncbi:YdeI/OmpD-associated family protein [Nonomuraea sediminis]|uniref:YdeI/OmpD-associated family protein n=1 Tax=Nonomuraea sediminis TaxID=2835864 RepID=UPI001BDCAE28|nr:YdeI/OmpD-associated family protein [Nonomuraea sediminis]
MTYLTFDDAAQWESWLAEHHEEAGEAWLLIAKKGSGRTSPTSAQTLEVALCYGWIDSHRMGHDASYFLQRYSPRRSGSPWSRINVDRAEVLIAEGRMRAPGHAEIEAAKADGRWDAAYASQATATVPEDLAIALAAEPAAAAAFGALDRTGRYAVILPLLKARTRERRAVLVARAIEALS